jgi:DinB family protein
MNDAADLPRAELPESIERLEEMPTFLEAALDAVPDDEFLSRPAPGEFSLVEQACHLRDLEREGYLVRVRRILSETLPALESFDGTAVAQARNYMMQDARMAAQEFAAARREVLGLLAATTPGDLDRTATFGEQRITLRDLVAMMEAHDRGHREEIERLIEALEDL